MPRKPAKRKPAVLLASGTLVLGAVVLPSGVSAQKAKTPAPTAVPGYAKDVAPVVEEFCTPCHAGKDAPGGVILPKGVAAGAALKKSAMWNKVAKNVANLHMPPEGMPQPTKAQRAALVKWVDSSFTEDCSLADPGRVTIRRLNRAEYNNTVRDLLGTNLRPADDFPSDDVGYGFDNIGDVLSISPLLMEKYMGAAERLAQEALPLPRKRTYEIKGDAFKAEKGVGDQSGGLFFLTDATATGSFAVKAPGIYDVRFVMGQQAAGPEPAKAEVTVDGKGFPLFEVVASREKPGSYGFPLKLEAGAHKVTVRFTNDFYRAEDKAAKTPAQDRNLLLVKFEAEGPKAGDAAPTPLQAWLVPKPLTKDEEPAAAKAALASFASRAFRRPATSAESDRLMSLYTLVRKAGEPHERGLQIGMQAVLASPSFLFRAELDPPGKAKRLLTGYEVASRLSYFLWSSMPDAALEAKAASGELLKPVVLQSETMRMLKDPKAKALTDNFALQWLQLRKLANFEPDPKQFPDFSDALRADMLAETTRTFDFVRAENRSILDFVDAKYTFLNARLARLYGLPPVEGDALRKVALTDPRRGGVLTQASVLAANSNPTRTSPTKRGRWILEQVLGSPPPPPPPGVGQLQDEKHFTDTMTIRQRMEEHRKNPACATCHRRMDTLGFGFENYDAIGRWRTVDGKFPVESGGTLPDGKSFETPVQLKAILLAQKDVFARTFAEKLLTFALGRGVDDGDKCHLDTIAKRAAPGGYRFGDLVQAVVLSDPFLKRRTDAPTKPTGKAKK